MLWQTSKEPQRPMPRGEASMPFAGLSVNFLDSKHQSIRIGWRA